MIYKSYEHYEGLGITAQHFDTCRAIHLPITINSYRDAKDWWDAREPDQWRGTTDRPVGKRERHGFRMRLRADKAVEFERDGSVVSVWYPNNTVDAQSPQSFTWGLNGWFEQVVLPRIVECSRNSNYGRVLYLKRASTPEAYVELTGGRRMANPDTLVVRCDSGPVNLSYNKETERWEPTDVDDLDCFEWFELNKSELRAASQKYNISEFVTAIETAMQMGAEIKTAGAFGGRYSSMVESKGADDKSILELLEEGRYIDAAQLVRIQQNGVWDPVNKRYNYDTKGLKQGDVKKIRHMAYRELGVTYLEQQPIVTLPMLTNIETKLRDFGKPVTDRVL